MTSNSGEPQDHQTSPERTGQSIAGHYSPLENDNSLCEKERSTLGDRVSTEGIVPEESSGPNLYLSSVLRLGTYYSTN